MTQGLNSILRRHIGIAQLYINVITEIVDIVIKHLFLTVITPHMNVH